MANFGKYFLQGLQSGQERGAAAARDRIKQDRDAQLQELLLGKKAEIDRQSEMAKEARRLKTLEDLLGKGLDRSVSIDGVSIGAPAALKSDEAKRNALIEENRVRAEALKNQYKDVPAWKQAVSRIPLVGAVASEFSEDIRNIRGNEEAIAQNETFIKSGAQAPESEFQRMRRSTIPGVFSSAEEKARYLDDALGAREGRPMGGTSSKMQRYLELKRKAGR